jgi:GNAT superfamily N-acetyltransferase
MSNQIVFTSADSAQKKLFDKFVETANSVWIASFDNSYGPGECSDRYVFLGKVEEELVNAFTLSSVGEGIFKISCLGTVPEHEKKGYACAALEEAKRFARSNGATILRLTVDDGRDDLVLFYEKRGFVLEPEEVVESDEVTEFDDWEPDEHVMNCSL